MEANIILEINSVLDDKQNAEIQWILQNGCHIFSVIYENVGQSKPNSCSAFYYACTFFSSNIKALYQI